MENTQSLSYLSGWNCGEWVEIHQWFLGTVEWNGRNFEQIPSLKLHQLRFWKSTTKPKICIEIIETDALENGYDPYNFHFIGVKKPTVIFGHFVGATPITKLLHF